MPPVSRISVNTAVEILVKKSKELFKTDKVPNYSDPVWQDLAEECYGAWKAHNWYNKFKTNWKMMVTLAREKLLLNTSRDVTINVTLNSSVEDDIKEFSIRDREMKEKESVFHCYLQEEEWILFQPLTIQVLNENKKIKCQSFPTLWNHILDDAFWKQNRLPCAFSCIGAQINTSSEIFLKVLGYCKSKKCNNEFFGYCKEKPRANNTEMHIYVRTIDTRTMDHENVQTGLDGNQKKKRERQKVEEKEIENSNKRKRRDKATVLENIVKMSETNTILRNPIKKIYEMRFEQSYVDFIHDISYYPFYVHYGLPAQMTIYKTYTASKSSSALSIGMIDNCAQSLIRPGGLESARLLIFAIVVKLDNTLFSVYQMISEQIGPDILEFFIKRWLRRSNSKPKQVTIQNSVLMLAACAQGFNDLSVDEYVNRVFESIIDKQCLPNNMTILRIDLTDVLQTVLQWPCLKAIESKGVREFYFKCIILLGNCENYGRFEKIFLLICTMALQNYKDSAISSKSGLTVDDVKRELRNGFLTWDISNDQYLELLQGQTTLNHLNFWKDHSRNLSKIEIFLQQLVDELRLTDEITRADLTPIEAGSSKIDIIIMELITSVIFVSQKGTELNPYFLPGIMIDLFNLVKVFPMWTAVSMPCRLLKLSKNYGQEYIENFMKRIMSSHINLLQVDNFLASHLKDFLNNSASRPTEQNRNSKSLTEILLHDKERDEAEDDVDIPENIENISPSKKNDNFCSHIGLSSKIPLRIQGNVNIESDACAQKRWETASNYEKQLNSRIHRTEIDKLLRKNEISPYGFHDNDINSKKITESNHQMKKKNFYNVSQKQTSESKFFKDFPEIKLYNHLEKKGQKIFFLRNGSKVPPSTLDNAKYSCTHTCGFDSLCRILVTSAVDDPNYRKFVKDSDNPTMNFVSSFITNQSKTKIWAERVRILLPYYQETLKTFSSKSREIVSEFSCFDSIYNIIQKVLESEPSAITVFQCRKCDHQFDKYDKVISFSPNHVHIEEKGFKDLQDAIECQAVKSDIKCKKCKNSSVQITMPNVHVIIDFDIRFRKNLGKTMTCQLKEFPLEIQLGQKYRLAGIINHQAAHFTAYCRKLSGSWQYYNDLNYQMDSCKNTERVEPHAAIYVLQNENCD